jgi:hypothetical protein
MGAWKKARHYSARNCTQHPGSPGQGGRPQGRADMDVEVSYLFTQRHQGEDPARRPGHAFRGQWRQRVRAPRRRPLGRHGLQGRGLRRDHRSNANIQQRPIWPLHCDARSRYGGESRHREQDRGVQGCNRAALPDVQLQCNRSPTAAPSLWCWPSNRQAGRTPQCRGWSTCGSSSF